MYVFCFCFLLIISNNYRGYYTLISSDFLFDKIIMNLFRNKAVNQRMKVVDFYFTKTEDKNIFLYIVSLKYFSWKKATNESIDVVRPNYSFEE